MRLHSSINEKDFPKYGTLAISLNWKTISKKKMSEIENDTATWIETPLSKFGFKCVMNKHDLCVDSSCECLCHHHLKGNIGDSQVESLLVLIKKTMLQYGYT